MRFLYLLLAAAPSVQASLVATVNGQTGLFPNLLTCQQRYSAPLGVTAFDVNCTAPNLIRPSLPAYAEVSASGPMHVVLTAIGGVIGTRCDLDGCANSEATITYNDQWTVTGGTGPGTLLFVPGISSNGTSSFTFHAGGLQPGGFIQFVFGEPFSVSYDAEVAAVGDVIYGKRTLSVNGSVHFWAGTCSGFSGSASCDQLPLITGSITSADSGDPFVGTPEPASPTLVAFAIIGLMCRRRATRA